MKSKIESYYDKQSLKYDEDRFQGNPVYYELLNSIDQMTLDPHITNKNVLEIGCGTGIIMERIKGNVKKIIGIDLSTGMLQAAKKKKLNVIKANAENLPFSDNSFDVVYSFKVLPHIPNIKKALEEIQRVTQKDGRMIFEFYNKYSIKRILFALDRKKVYTRFDSFRDIKSYLPRNVEIESFCGIRTLTLHAGVFKIRKVQKLFLRIEKALSNTPLARISSYVIFTVKFLDKNRYD